MFPTYNVKNPRGEEIREYSILIDSKDRNYQIYPDPFSYEVKFNPLPKAKTVISGQTFYQEEPNPVINDKLTNVRYIKLETVILPLHTKIYEMLVECEETGPFTRWQVDTANLLTNNLYTVLSLGEYTDINYRSTNDVLADSFATIYFDSKINETHYKGITNNGLKVFPPDQLGKIDRLRISFMDPYGIPLRCNHVDSTILSDFTCRCADPTGDDDTTCFKHNLFHPLNPIFQHHLHFKVGVVEPRLRNNYLVPELAGYAEWEEPTKHYHH